MNWSLFVVSLFLVVVSAVVVMYPYETTRFYLQRQARAAYPRNKRLEPSPKAVRFHRVIAAIVLAVSVLVAFGSLSAAPA